MAFRTSTSRTNNVVEAPKSRYTQGGVTDRYPNRVGWWERFILEKQDTDLTVEIFADEDRRPDKVAHRIYDNVRLTWLVLQYNAIVDVETEFRTGMTIRLPEERRVYLDIVTNPTGGNRVA